MTTAIQTQSPEKILCYTNEPVVARLAEKMEITLDEADTLFRDMLRFLVLCANQRGPFAPPERIDAAWHNFILFTKDYADFCEQNFGTFIHHVPHVGSHSGRSRVPRTLALAEEMFGPLGSNWQVVNDSVNDCSPSTNCQDNCKAENY